MNSNTRIKIRDRFISHLPNHCVTFVFSGLPIRKSADAEYPFQANRNFYYLTGIEEPGAVLVFDNQNEILFLRDVDPKMEKWVGHYMRKEEATAVSGIKDVRYFEDFDKFLNKVMDRKTRFGLDLDHNTYTEEAFGSAISMADYVGIERVLDITDLFVRARMVKFDEEVEAIKHAAEVTNTAIESMLLEMKPGNNENDMASKFLYEAHKAGGDLMFETIAASGKNATVLHYVKNDEPLVDGEMILLDLGVRVKGYGADISRTYPINGKFTERQKAVYQAVLDTFHAINAAAKPGVSLQDLNDLAKEKLAEGCRNLGLIESDDELDQYYYHSVGHSLGLDTHDVWIQRDFPLEPGNVITNEPGLYIAQENIGIRIETDLLITQDGNIDLAPQIKREIEDIEALLNK